MTLIRDLIEELIRMRGRALVGVVEAVHQEDVIRYNSRAIQIGEILTWISRYEKENGGEEE